MDTAILYSDWQDVTVTAVDAQEPVIDTVDGDPQSTLAVIDPLIVEWTNTSTIDARLIGRLENNGAILEGVRIEIDETPSGTFTADSVVYTDSTGSFIYEPREIVVDSMGSAVGWNIDVRAVYYQVLPNDTVIVVKGAEKSNQFDFYTPYFDNLVTPP